MGSSDNFCLRWNDFEANISSSFRELRQSSEFFDVTLCCDNGKDLVQAHKVILAACSPLFRRILSHNETQQNPFLYLKGINKEELLSVLNFMYHGEVNIAQESLNNFLSAAEELSVKGLTSSETQMGGKQSSTLNSFFNEDAERGNNIQTKRTVKRTPPKKLILPTTTKRKVEPGDADGDGEDYLKRIKAEPELPIGVTEDNGDDFDVGDEDYESFGQYEMDESNPGTSTGGGIARIQNSDTKELETCSMSYTQRGHPLLLDSHGHSYVKNRDATDKTYWVCQHHNRLKCRVSLHTDGLVITYRSSIPHNHEPVPIKRNRYTKTFEFSE